MPTRRARWTHICEEGIRTDADLSAAFPLASGLEDLSTPGLVYADVSTTQPSLRGEQERAQRGVICDPHACVALHIASCHAPHSIAAAAGLGAGPWHTHFKPHVSPLHAAYRYIEWSREGETMSPRRYAGNHAYGTCGVLVLRWLGHLLR